MPTSQQWHGSRAERGAFLSSACADGVAALLAHELDTRTGAARHGGTLARLELDGVHERADGDVGQRQGITRLDVSLGTGLDGVADLETLGLQDVRLGAICVIEQRERAERFGFVTRWTRP